MRKKIEEIPEFEEKMAKKADEKQTTTAFILIFPTLVLAGIAAFYAPVSMSIVAVILALYQFLVQKKFIQEYYEK